MPGTRTASFANLTTSDAHASRAHSPPSKVRSMSHEAFSTPQHHRRPQNDRRSGTPNSDDTVLASRNQAMSRYAHGRTSASSVSTITEAQYHDDAFVRRSLALLNTPLPDLPTPTALITLADLPTLSSPGPQRPSLPPPLPPRARPIDPLHSWMPTPDESPVIVPYHRAGSQQKSTPQPHPDRGRQQSAHHSASSERNSGAPTRQSTRFFQRPSIVFDTSADEDGSPLEDKVVSRDTQVRNNAASDIGSSTMASGHKIPAVDNDQVALNRNKAPASVVPADGTSQPKGKTSALLNASPPSLPTRSNQATPRPSSTIMPHRSNADTVESKVIEAHEACVQAHEALAKSKAALEAAIAYFDGQRRERDVQATVPPILDSSEGANSLASHQETLVACQTQDSSASPPITQASMEVSASDNSALSLDSFPDHFPEDIQRLSVDGSMSFMYFKTDGGSEESAADDEAAEDSDGAPSPISAIQVKPDTPNQSQLLGLPPPDLSHLAIASGSSSSTTSTTPLQSPTDDSSRDFPLRHAESTHLMYALNNTHISEESIRNVDSTPPTEPNQQQGADQEEDEEDVASDTVASHADNVPSGVLEVASSIEENNSSQPEVTEHGYPNEGYPNEGYPSEGYPNEAYSGEGYPNEGVGNQEDDQPFAHTVDGQSYDVGPWQYDDPEEPLHQPGYPTLPSRSTSMSYSRSSSSRNIYSPPGGYDIAEEGQVISPDLIDSSTGENMIYDSSSQKLKLVEIPSPEPIRTPPMRSGSSMLRNYSSLERISEEIERGGTLAAGSNEEPLQHFTSQFSLDTESECRSPIEPNDEEEHDELDGRVSRMQRSRENSPSMEEEPMPSQEVPVEGPMQTEKTPVEERQYAEIARPAEEESRSDPIAAPLTGERPFLVERELQTSFHPSNQGDPVAAPPTKPLRLVPRTPDRQQSLSTKKSQPALAEETPQSVRTLSSLIGDHLWASQRGKSSKASDEALDSSPTRPTRRWRESASLKATGGVVKDTIRKLETQNQLLHSTAQSTQSDSDHSANQLVQSHWSSETSQFDTSDSALGFQLRSDFDDKFGLRGASLQRDDSAMSWNVSHSGIDTSVSMDANGSRSGVDADTSRSGPELGICDSAASLFESQLQSMQAGQRPENATSNNLMWLATPDSAYDPLFGKPPTTDLEERNKAAKLFPVTTSKSPAQVSPQLGRASSDLAPESPKRSVPPDANESQTTIMERRSKPAGTTNAIKGRLARAFFDKSRGGKESSPPQMVGSYPGGTNTADVSSLESSPSEKRTSLAVDVAQANSFRSRRGNFLHSEATQSPVASPSDHSGWLSRRLGKAKAAHTVNRKGSDQSESAPIAAPELAGIKPGHVKLSHRLFDRARHAGRPSDSPPNTAESEKSRSTFPEQNAPVKGSVSHARKLSWSSTKSFELVPPSKGKKEKTIGKKVASKMDKGKGRAVSPVDDSIGYSLERSKSTPSDPRLLRSNTVDSPALPTIKPTLSSDYLIPPGRWPFEEEDTQKRSSAEPTRPTLQRTHSSPSRTTSIRSGIREDGIVRAKLDLDVDEHRLSPSVLMSWSKSNSFEYLQNRYSTSEDGDGAEYHTAFAGTPTSRSSMVLGREPNKSRDDLSGNMRQPSSDLSPRSSTSTVAVPYDDPRSSVRLSTATITALTPKASLSDMELVSPPSYSDMNKAQQQSSLQANTPSTPEVPSRHDDETVREQARRNFQDWLEKQARTRRYWEKEEEGVF